MATRQISLIEFKPKDLTRPEWDRYHIYRRIRHEERRPEDPLWPDDEVEEMMKRDHPHYISRYFGALDGDDLVSTFYAGVVKPEAPEYETNKHLIWADFGVLKDRRRQGIGTDWLRKLAALAQEYDRRVLTFGTEEDDGRAFLKSIGAEMKLAGAENRLDFEEVDWDMVRTWVAEGEKKSPDTELVFYEGRVPEEAVEELCKAMTEFLNTMPFDDLDHGDIVMTPEDVKDMYERYDVLKAEHHTYLTREPEGTISGITDIAYFPSQPDRVSQQFTGVDTGQRGRGLGKWLKAAMLEYVRERYPEVRWVVTGNANSNAAMLAINHRLGFKEHKAAESFQMSLDSLKSHLEKVGAKG